MIMSWVPSTCGEKYRIIIIYFPWCTELRQSAEGGVVIPDVPGDGGGGGDGSSGNSSDDDRGPAGGWSLQFLNLRSGSPWPDRRLAVPVT